MAAVSAKRRGKMPRRSPTHNHKDVDRHSKDGKRLDADPYAVSVRSDDAKEWRSAWTGKVMREGSDSLQLIRPIQPQAYPPRTSKLSVREPHSPPKPRRYVMRRSASSSPFHQYLNSPPVPGCDFSRIKYESGVVQKHSSKAVDFTKLRLKKTADTNHTLVFDKVLDTASINLQL